MKQSQLQLLEAFGKALAGDDWESAAAAICAIDNASLWANAITSYSLTAPHPNIASGFHTYWTEKGFRVRFKINNDKELLKFLKFILPPYSGGSQRLYRGENVDRWLAKRIGFGWTPKKDVAEMFASGLAASEGSGGVLLEADIPASAIIAGPSRHSIWLDEYEHIVDSYFPFEVKALQSFPWVP